MVLENHKFLLQDNLLNSIYGNLISTLISFVVILLVYLLYHVLVVRKIENARQKQKMHVRAFYVACVVFVFLMAHVWVDGFTHLLTILGLVSAGLVVSNKETIMNFTGWLVITWRGLFSEEDLIQVQQYKGYVKRIGILYFTVYEVSDLGGGITGRVIRVPNGLISTNPIINFSQASHLHEERFVLSVSSDNDFDYLKQHIKTIVDETVKEFYQEKNGASPDYVAKQNRQMAGRIRLGVKVSIQPKSNNLSSVELTARYFCFSQDAEKIQEQILLRFLKSLKTEKSIKLAP